MITKEICEVTQPSEKEIVDTVLSMERAALDRWGKGDPDGFLEIADEDVVYFDPFLEKQLEGKQALTKLYAGLRGQLQIDSFEILNPRVKVDGRVAILTYNFVSHASGDSVRWNTTEVYQQRSGVWKIVHTHWSLTQPRLAAPVQ